MDPRTYGRKAAIIWRIVHLSFAATILGILAALVQPEAANGIGIMLGTLQGMFGIAGGAYTYGQSQVEVAHGPTPHPPPRASGTAQEIG